MKLREISKKQTAHELNENMARLFNTKLDLESFSLEQLQDARNKVRTALSQFETNESYTAVDNNEPYQKNRMFLNVLNKAISERGDINELPLEEKEDQDGDGDNDFDDVKIARMMASGMSKPEAIAKVKGKSKKVDEKAVSTAQQQAAGIAHAAQKGEIPKSELKGASKEMAKMKKGDLKDFASTPHKGLPQHKTESIVKEGEEDKAELVMAAKDMVDRITSWMEDTAEMQSESMLELGDAIRDELGQEQSQGFIDQVKPALESLYQALEGTRQSLTNGVAMLTGETMPEEPMGAEEPSMEEPTAEPAMEPEMEPTVDTEDEFAASEPAAGGEEPTGRTRRESIERTLRQHKILEHQRLARSLGTILSSKKK